MFTGIIEETGKLISIVKEGGNSHLTIEAKLTNELKINQSVAHNGVCLSVTEINAPNYTVTAVQETLSKTNLGKLKPSDLVNLERSLKLGDRLDGHLVQGHVDQTGSCESIKIKNGSHIFGFIYNATKGNIVAEKGSITVNGISLTAFKCSPGQFFVTIIPLTLEHTNFGKMKIGNTVNLEFDIIGKYVAQFMKRK